MGKDRSCSSSMLVHQPDASRARTDKLYITHSEWSGGLGDHTAAGTGAKARAGAYNFARLPFDCCALTLKPFETPMATTDGVVYDLLSIIPYLRKHGTDPVTGKKLSAGDLIKLNFVKNDDGEFHDPLTFKPFNQHTHLVAIKPSGNVYARETIDRLNIKPNHWHDLVSDEPFTKADIITLQDPHNVEGRDLSQFHHLQNNLKADEDIGEGGSLSGINMSAIGGAAAQLRSIARGRAIAEADNPVIPDGEEASASNEILAKKEEPKSSAKPYNAAAYSTGRTAASLTSTSADIVTRSERELIDEEEYMYERIKEKAYVRLVTNFGNINVELHADRAPRTCHNFVMLARQGKYANTVFHRLIPGFMIQGGDPTGTGRGGESYWGKPFQDEFNKRNAFRHDARGILSMANHGHWTNGSQFFFTFRATPHLDQKHTVFGRIVGGMDALDRMEKVAPDPATDRPVRPIKLMDVEVFKDPYEDYQKRLQKRLARERDEEDATGTRRAAREAREKDRTTWFGTNLGEKQIPRQPVKPASREMGSPSIKSDGVGKYLNSTKRLVSEIESTDTSASDAAKKKRKASGFGDFSAW